MIFEESWSFDRLTEWRRIVVVGGGMEWFHLMVSGMVRNGSRDRDLPSTPTNGVRVLVHQENYTRIKCGEVLNVRIDQNTDKIDKKTVIFRRKIGLMF